MTKAIVTLATGVYRELWEAYAAPTWQAFCDRRGYELVALHEPINKAARLKNSIPDIALRDIPSFGDLVRVPVL